MEKAYTFEPLGIEMFLTKLAGGLLMRGYYSKFVSSLDIEGNEKILDYCCGSGIISKMIAARLKNGHIIYTDVSKLWLEHSGNKLKGFKNTGGSLLGDFSSMIAGGEYDRIILHYALHDFPPEYRPQILKQLVINLKKNGTMTIREPLNARHGFELYEFINLIEPFREISYEYNIVKKSVAGQYIDLKCVKKQDKNITNL